jgi:serine/threonine protein kinase
VKNNEKTTLGTEALAQCPKCHAILGEELCCPYCGHDIPDPRIGVVLDGRYRVDRLLGRGGYGRVYQGTHLALGGPVAVKFLLAEWAARPRERERFRREAAALVKLRHPGVVVAFDVGEHAGEPYLVMEYVEGTPLAQLVPTVDRELAPERLVALLDQALQVLEATHAHGFVHRDLKPDNILVFRSADGEERVKILDFGLALTREPGHETHRLTSDQTVVGTPLYMAPEQASHQEVGPPCDVYAMGVVLYELLTGAPPFMGRNSTDIMAQHMYIEPPPASERGLGRPVPPALEAVARWALRKQPAERPTAAEMRRALREAMAGEDAVSRAEKATQARRWAAGASREDRALPRPVMEPPEDTAVDVELPLSAEIDSLASTGPVVPVGPVGPAASFPEGQTMPPPVAALAATAEFSEMMAPFSGEAEEVAPGPAPVAAMAATEEFSEMMVPFSGEAEEYAAARREARSRGDGPGEERRSGPSVAASRSLALLWDVAAERQEALRTALGMRGVSVRLWTGAPPPPILDEQPVKAVIVGWGGGAGPGAGGTVGMEKVAALRAQPASARLPLLVIDVPGGGAVAGLIRAGASDAVLQAAGEEQICTKVLRLIQRGR